MNRERSNISWQNTFYYKSKAKSPPSPLPLPPRQIKKVVNSGDRFGDLATAPSRIDAFFFLFTPRRAGLAFPLRRVFFAGVRLPVAPRKRKLRINDRKYPIAEIPALSGAINSAASGAARRGRVEEAKPTWTRWRDVDCLRRSRPIKKNQGSLNVEKSGFRKTSYNHTLAH